MELSENRLRHSASVAFKMKELSERIKLSPNQAFILGFLHDIGYAFTNEQSDHAHVGGLALKEQGYIYWQEVFWHGVPQDEYDSPMLRLLNYVDIITNSNGEYVTFDERLKNIESRYGKNSPQVEIAVKMSDIIKEQLKARK